jgi:TfoX N-terminal domain
VFNVMLPAIITAKSGTTASHNSGTVKLARDKGLEELLNDSLATMPGLTQKAMFGGWAWLVNGNLLCGARSDGMLVRLGKENEAWALEIPGIVPMTTRGRQMRGWVRAAPDVYVDDAFRQRLVDVALEFNRSLPKK